MNVEKLLRINVYHIKQQITQLSERDRIVRLGIVLLVMLVVWFFLVYGLQKGALQETQAAIVSTQTKINEITQKKVLLHALTNNPVGQSLVSRFKNLIRKEKQFQAQIAKYSQRYLAYGDLAKLLHDVLEKTGGVTINHFGTIAQKPMPIQPQANPAPQKTEDSKKDAKKSEPLITFERIYYRLNLHGTYFSIMEYLKRLENLPLAIYWDTFDYTVTKYPDADVKITFYTLKSLRVQPLASSGGEQ